MSDDQFANRKRLSFAQAEGVEALPHQLLLKEVSTELRAKLWFLVHESMLECREYPSTGGRPYLFDPLKTIMYAKHVFVDHKMADEFENRFDDLSSRVKAIFASGNY